MDLACTSKARQLVSSPIPASISTLFISEFHFIICKGQSGVLATSLLNTEALKEWWVEKIMLYKGVFTSFFNTNLF